MALKITCHNQSACTQELKLLDDEANVYKLIGPALVKQDPIEAKSNVEKRLEFIGHELSRLETQSKQLEEKRSQKHTQVELFTHEAHISKVSCLPTKNRNM